jgi:hypothetical protein
MVEVMGGHGDGVLKAQLVMSGEGPPRRGHTSPFDKPCVK